MEVTPEITPKRPPFDRYSGVVDRKKPRRPIQYLEWKIFLLNISIFLSMLFVAAYRLPGGVAGTVLSAQPLTVVFLTPPFRNIQPIAKCLMPPGDGRFAERPHGAEAGPLAALDDDPR